MERSNRQRLLDLFRGTKQQGVLCVCDLTYWRDAQLASESLPERYCGKEGLLRLHLDLGVVPYYVYAIDEETEEGRGRELSVHQIGGAGRPYNGVFGLRLDGVDSETKRSGDLLTTTFRIGGTLLTQRKQYLPDSYCYAFLEYPVKSVDDLVMLRRLVEHYSFYDTGDDYRALSNLWSESGVPIAPLPRSPLSALIVDWMGVEGFTYAIADYPEETQKTLECIDRANDEAFRLVLKSDAELFHFCDNLSAANYAGFFPRFADAYYRRRFAQLHANGKHAAVHIDGTLRGILDQVAATGADCVEALTTAPVGDIPTEELRNEVKNRSTILWGGMPACMFTNDYSRADIERMVSAIVGNLPRLTPFIAGTADQLPPDADLELFRYAVQLLAEEGGKRG